MGEEGGEYPIGFKGMKTTTEAYGEVEWGGDLVQRDERVKASWRVGRIERYTTMANDTAVHLQLCFC